MIKAVVACLLATQVAEANLQATLTPIDSHVDFATESFLLDYEITNAGPGSVSFLPWKTPIDEVWEDLFLIHDANGNEIKYTGKVARRGATLDEHFITLAKGETRSAVVDLTRSYLMPADGMVSITLRHVNATGAPKYVAMNQVKMELARTELMLERHTATLNGSAGPGRKLAQSVYDCDSSQVAAINDGRGVAYNTQIPRALSCLGSSGSYRCSRYSTWFGSYTSTRYSKVKTCWQKIQAQFLGASFACCTGCGSNCGSNLYAYVYPDDTEQVMFLCGLYFSIPSERGGTLTHEQSHFDATCGTDDIAYSESSCKSLASTNPDSAITNADNHCYFGAL